MRVLLLIIFLCISSFSYSQKDTLRIDSIGKKGKKVSLNEIEIVAEKDNSFGISRLNNVEGTTIYAGKKSEVIYMKDLNANFAANNSRQVFSKIPGINIFENDGSGATIGIGGRGLNPNRISNFNTRQNGYDISADALGYPESYYTPPTEAIERIEILRGAAGLQFGTQFGGMINYKFAEAPANKKVSGKFRQTGGSYGFFNSFNQLSGTVKKISYNTFYQYKNYEGWRDRSELNTHTAFASVKYQINENFFIKAEYTLLRHLAQQPGGLTDKQFATDPKIVGRERNWFKVNWNLFSFVADYKVSESGKLNFVFFKTNAGRDALGNLGRIDRSDDTSTNRNLLSDVYDNFGAELRFLQRYQLFNFSSHFLIGARLYKGNTDRKQGDADKTDKASFKFLNPNNLENSAYVFPSSNYAFFIENIFQLTKKWSVTPGVRFENIVTKSNGYYRLTNKDQSGNILLDMKIEDSRNNSRHFILGGIGTQFKLSMAAELYANISQNYRSINFNDMRILNPNAQVDPNLKDESGYTADGGLRGVIKNVLYYDVGGFYINYLNRIGSILKVDTVTYNIIRYRTNISNSRNAGIEAFAEVDWMKLIRKNAKAKISTFINFAYINAIYVSSKQSAYKNKKVEYVPNIILRTGLTYAYRKFSLTYQCSYTSEQYSDADNSKLISSAISGLIPAFTVMDISATYNWRAFALSAGINNAANKSYFTRRAEGYPGPGIIPADPINTYITLQFKF